MHIRSATRSDLADIATVTARAMIDDELALWLSLNDQQPPHVFRQVCLMTNTRRWNCGMYMLVMVLDEKDAEWQGKEVIVGYAAYEKEVGASDDSSKRKSSLFDVLERLRWRLDRNYNWYLRNNLGSDTAKIVDLERELDSNEACSRFDKYWELSLLAVDPAFHRRGIGAQFLAWGKEHATADNVPLWLWSSVKGYPLYKRQGFEEIGLLTFGGGALTAPVLAWYPQSHQ